MMAGVRSRNSVRTRILSREGSRSGEPITARNHWKTFTAPAGTPELGPEWRRTIPGSRTRETKLGQAGILKGDKSRAEAVAYKCEMCLNMNIIEALESLRSVRVLEHKGSGHSSYRLSWVSQGTEITERRCYL